MPNAIKYNLSAETLALKKGNFYIGTGDVGKGPTSSTGFYNGITPPSGGYTIYLNKASGGPSIYTVNTEAQLTALTNSISVMTNLVPNGGNFADGTVNPFYWSYGGVHSVVDISNNRPYNGSQSTKALQIVNGGCWMSTDGMMTVGKTYTFSFWARKTDGTSGTVGNDKGPVWNNQNGSGELNNFSYPWYNSVLPTTTIDGTWRRYTYTFYYNAARTQLYFYGVVGTTIFTEFQITEGTAAGGPGIPTTSECLNWYSSVPTDKMIFNMDYPAIVTNGLLLNLDAGFVPSYPTVRSTWYDISSGGNNGSLINGPTFSSDNGGSIVFDGVDDYGSLPFTYDVYNGGNYNPITMCGWYKLPVFQISLSEEAPGGFQDSGVFMGFWVHRVTPNPNTRIRFNVMFGGVGGSEVSYTHTMDGQWRYYVATFNSSGLCKLYSNGVLQNMASPVITQNAKFNGTAFLVKDRGRTPVNCSIGGIQIYNRELTSTEVLQNYNAQKGRFGL